MKRSIHPVEDLSGLAPLMREAKVPSVDLAEKKTPGKVDSVLPKVLTLLCESFEVHI